MIHRGIDPGGLPVRYALAYNRNRKKLFEQQKMVWKQAASEIFGDGQ